MTFGHGFQQNRDQKHANMAFGHGFTLCTFGCSFIENRDKGYISVLLVTVFNKTVTKSISS